MDEPDAAALFPDDCLPPEASYDSRDDCHEAINAWAALRGYAFSTGRSTKADNGRLTVEFVCDCDAGRAPSSLTERRRQTSSRRVGCRFSIVAKEGIDRITWTVRHRAERHFNYHNHGPSLAPTAHPTHRKISKSDTSTIHNLANAGIAPKEIRSYLQTHSTTIATQQDIYNCIAQGKRNLVEGQSNIHALANELDREGFWSRMRLSSDNRVTDVIFAHPKSLEYLAAYPDVLILDCTYKTNKYKMPLLDMVGVDARQRSFCIAFAFLSGEEETNFCWALERLRSMYETCGARLPSIILTDLCQASIAAAARWFPGIPSLLCIWHANKAVVRHCQPSFTKNTSDPKGLQAWQEFYSMWNNIVASPNKASFEERLDELKRRYTPSHVAEVGYILETWLDGHKERIVKAWVDCYLHFDNVVTSRGEGIHYLIKQHLRTSQLDLFEAWRSIKLAVINQVTELKAAQAKEQVTMPLGFSGSLYSIVRGWVSHEALRKVEGQRALLKNQLPPCTGKFKTTLGLPCAHYLERLIQEKQPLQLSDFHRHWRYHRKGAPQLIIEPRPLIDQVATNLSSSRKTSTRREPSAFERVENAILPRAEPTCSNCHAKGHIRSSKKCPLRWAYLLPPLTGSVASSAAVRTNAQQQEESQPANISQEQSQPANISQEESQPANISQEESQPMPQLAYTHPYAIYQRYCAARQAWYESLPRGALQTNQEYRKAIGLPQRYAKTHYDWCLDYKQMGRQYVMTKGRRDWTKEEMMAYLDWDKAEQDRVEASVAVEMRQRPFSARRGMQEIWDAAERDIQAQRG